MSLEEVPKIRACLLQAKQLAGEKQKVVAATIAKELAGAATAGEPAAAVAKEPAAGAVPGGAEAEPSSEPEKSVEEKPEGGLARAEIAGEGDHLKAEVAVEGEVPMDIDVPEAAPEVADEEVKAFWLSGVAAVVEVSNQEFCRGRPRHRPVDSLA